MERGTILTTAAAGLTFVLTYYLHAWLQHPFKKKQQKQQGKPVFPLS